MNTNPTSVEELSAVANTNWNGGYPSRKPAAYGTDEIPEPAVVEHQNRSAEAERFVRRLGLVSGLFLMVVFSVFREIQHNREMYRMSQRVAAAEADSLRRREALRMEEAREASLVAALEARGLLAGNPGPGAAKSRPIN
jgi:hypothetical protein